MAIENSHFTAGLTEEVQFLPPNRFKSWRKVALLVNNIGNPRCLMPLSLLFCRLPSGTTGCVESAGCSGTPNRRR